MSKNVLITGAAGGLGTALARALADGGAQLLLVDRKLRALERLCDEVEHRGAPAPAYCQLDLVTAGPPEMEELVSGFVESYGGLHALVHCAAQFQGLQPLDQVPGDTWLRLIQINLNAAWLLSAVCLPHLRASSGALVFLLDNEAAGGDAYWGPYGISKAALRAMTRTFAEELEGSGCRVHGVDPGPLRTDLRAAAFHAEDPLSVPEPAAAARRIAELILDPPASPPTFIAPA